MPYYDLIYSDKTARINFADDASAVAWGAVDRSDQPPPIVIVALRDVPGKPCATTYETVFEDTRIPSDARLSVRTDAAWRILDDYLLLRGEPGLVPDDLLDCIERAHGYLSDRPVFSTSPPASQEPSASLLQSLRTDLGTPFLTCHSGGPDGYFVRLKYATLAEAQRAHTCIVALYASEPEDEEPVTSNRSRLKLRDETRYRPLMEVMEGVSPDPRPVEPFPDTSAVPAETPATSQEPGWVARDPTVLALDYAVGICGEAAGLEAEGSTGRAALEDCERRLRRYSDRIIERLSVQEPSLRLSDLRRIVRQHIASNHKDIKTSSEWAGAKILDLAARSILRSIETELGAETTYPPEMEI